MNKSIFLRFAMIALFLLAYQSSTIHSTQHLLKTDKECSLCVNSKVLDGNLHETTVPVFIEATWLAVYTVEQSVVLKKRLDFVQKPLVRQTDFSGMQHFSVTPIPLGFFSHAPPKNS
jgi:hypothetical protein